MGSRAVCNYSVSYPTVCYLSYRTVSSGAITQYHIELSQVVQLLSIILNCLKWCNYSVSYRTVSSGAITQYHIELSQVVQLFSIISNCLNWCNYSTGAITQLLRLVLAKMMLLGGQMTEFYMHEYLPVCCIAQICCHCQNCQPHAALPHMCKAVRYATNWTEAFMSETCESMTALELLYYHD